MPKRLFSILLFHFCILINAQNSLLLDSLKRTDNLAEYMYVHLDAFSENPRRSNLLIFENVSKNSWRTSWRTPKTKNEFIAQLYFFINYAYQLKQFGNISESIIYYEKAYDLYKKQHIENYDIIEFCLKPLANNYTRLGDAERAEDILKVTIEKALRENNTSHLVSGYSNLAGVLRTHGQYNAAIKYLKLGLELGISNGSKARIYSDLAKIYLLKNEFEKAQDNLELSEGLNEKSNLSIVVSNLKTSGIILLKKSDFKKALEVFNSCLNKSVVVFGKHDREVAKILNQIAEVYRKMNERELSLKFYQKSLSTLLPKYDPQTVFENPKSTYFYAENTLIQSLDGRASLLIEMLYFEEAIENYNLSFLIENELQATYLTQNSKLIQQQENRERAEKCIELCYLLFEKNNEINWIETAFQFAEKTKSAVLHDAKEISLSKSLIKNDSLFELEKFSLFKKAQLNKNIIVEQLKGGEANINLLSQLTKERDVVFTQLQLLNDKIKSKYPNINPNKNLEITVQDVKEKLLIKNTVFVEFFDGMQNVYIFSISKTRPITILKIEKNDDFKNELSKFLSFFSDGRGTALQNNVKEYTYLGYNLYKKLLEPIASNNILLIPDGQFSFLPFDALITEKTTVTNFDKIPYLIKKSSIRYGYSATILLEDKEEKIYENSEVLGFFPVFENSHRGLSELNYTIEEAKSMRKEVKGEFLLKNNASKEAFNKLNKRYPIIHLSTHATAGDYYTPASVEFYNETLYLPEIYGYNFKTDLLVLSACETGIGALRKGEGVLSLARGFSYAGVKNLIVSLWKVNDRATEKLMSSFYRNYNYLKNKSEALHQSKLDYLYSDEVSSIKKSPYYWASFIYIGETSLVSNNYFNYYWLIIFGILLIVGFILLKNVRFGSN